MYNHLLGRLDTLLDAMQVRLEGLVHARTRRLEEIRHVQHRAGGGARGRPPMAASTLV